MRSIILAASLVLATAASAAEPAPAAGAPAAAVQPSAWELDAFVGYGQIAFPWPDTQSMTWWNGGPAFALSVAYRGPHFTHPFIDISYVPILSSGQYTYVTGTNASSYASNSLYGLGFIIGPGWDVDWFRARVGLGLYNVTSSSTVNGVTSTASAMSIGFLVSAAALVWRPDPFAVGVEARLAALQAPMNGIYQTSWSVGLTGRWDFVRRP